MSHPIIDEIVATESWGKPSAAKRGRNPAWPYVPVIIHAPCNDQQRERSEQIRAKAFVTRQEAIDYAALVIDHRREDLRTKLADPRYRALRSWHGLFQDLPIERIGGEQ